MTGKMSFGQAPNGAQPPAEQDQTRFVLNPNGTLLDRVTNEFVTLETATKILAKEKLDAEQNAARLELAKEAALEVLEKDFAHLSDAPMSARSMVSRQELIQAMVDASILTLKAVGQ